MTEIRTPSPSRTPPRGVKDKANGLSREPTSPRIAHTLTACCRCRHRKQRCDTGLPRCGPCERTNSHCEYFDQAKGVKIPRHYVVHLQHKVRDLERQLEALESEDLEPDPESLVRDGAAVRIQEHDESKFLGPSSGIAITRLVMHLAKRFTQSESINDIVTQDKAQEIKETFEEEEKKPTSKVYPQISDVAAPDLPDRGLANVLVNLFHAKVTAMYPFLHEPTFWQEVDELYAGSTDPYQNFAVRMVFAISLQRTSTEYAGLADSFYLAALKYLEKAVEPMNVRTIQCFCLIGAYSLLTPTRTAVYYVIGLSCRLAQALGLCDEKTIAISPNGKPANVLEIDMRRRLFWCVMNMEYALAYSMGRASSFATSLDHLDVQWYRVVDDEYITKDGVNPNAPMSLKKWVSIHFMKMRLLQVEIRRKLYQKKRPTPRDHNDPWFKEMEDKLIDWRDATPTTDGKSASGFDKAWFVGRYNIMLVHMFRPSPQCPTPAIEAARRCFPACTSNIYMHRDQIEHGNVDMTWIFTQAMFMTINTILWSLSFEEIRQEHAREDVQRDLNVALDCIKKASERWPGVESALELYKTLIIACMRIYDQTGNVEISAASPSDTTGRSRTASPVTGIPDPFPLPSLNRASAPEASRSHLSPSPFGQMGPLSFSGQPSVSQHNGFASQDSSRPSSYLSTILGDPDASLQQYDAVSQIPLPATYNDMVSWNPDFDFSTSAPSTTVPALSPYEPAPPLGADMNGNAPMFDMSSPSNVPWTDYLYPPSYEGIERSAGLNQQQQMELMKSLQTTGIGRIQHTIDATNAVFNPPSRQQ
ncbi:hypothetical protein BT63DRAFT_191025 [Microthyrium microscopicum]|uniref:Zn(2)-C6 fungal-type domain-containing protein n=1 Tax=Microthyrium microscopicum TaxID=703497 RepID=A0A6A6UIZ6_9PEZI|nr:hypothetical protein BT63DRAFT_191025 [Microthyrium microscopicum]